MDKIPDLSQLSHEQKDALIYELLAQINSLQAKVKELEGRLAQTSRNSNKPPSAQGLNKPKPKSLRVAGQNSTGGQAGHAGHTLKKVSTPDETVLHHPPSHCERCHRPLSDLSIAE